MSDHIRQSVTDIAVPAETSLHYFLGKSSGSKAPGVVITEDPNLAHLILRGESSNDSLKRVVKQVLGVDLPVEPGCFESGNDISVYWLGPTEWLILLSVSEQVEIETKLRESLSGHVALVDVSSGQTLINLSGAGVELVLKKSCAYDFHASNFGVGRCVQTVFAKASAMVSKKADGSFDLVIRRSFADYLALWLLDAGEEFCCRIDSKNSESRNILT